MSKKRDIKKAARDARQARQARRVINSIFIGLIAITVLIIIGIYLLTN
ncbi:MAG: hypothetical protein J6N92_04340 [Alloprevotella sp.]|nr:hypothetical protein [Alloprevotella sp.]